MRYSEEEACKAKERPEVNLPTIEEVEAEIASDSYNGWCTYCGAWTHDCCEPDAHNYECPECSNRTVYGAEELIVQNMVK